MASAARTPVPDAAASSGWSGPPVGQCPVPGVPSGRAVTLPVPRPGQPRRVPRAPAAGGSAVTCCGHVLGRRRPGLSPGRPGHLPTAGPCPAPAASRAASGLAHGREGRPELPQTRTPLRPRSPLPTPPRPGRSLHSCPATIGEPPEPPQTPGGRARSSEEQAGAGKAELEGEDRPLRTRSAVSTGRSCRARPDSATRGFWSGDERAVPRASRPPWGSALGWGVGPARDQQACRWP